MLRRLGHVSAEGVVTLKGRAAGCISTGDELLSAELLLNGVFGGLNPHQLVALVSVLIPTEKSNVRRLIWHPVVFPGVCMRTSSSRSSPCSSPRRSPTCGA